MVRFINELSNFFPCSICGVHLKNYLKEHDIYPSTKNREEMEKYYYLLHEDVNQRNRKAKKHTFEEVREAFKLGKSWKEFGGYPIRTSPRYTSVDSSIFLSHFNSTSGSIPIPPQPNNDSKYSSNTGLIVSTIVLAVLLAIFIILFAVYVSGSTY
jgi:hypothetical protein